MMSYSKLTASDDTVLLGRPFPRSILFPLGRHRASSSSCATGNAPADRETMSY